MNNGIKLVCVIFNLVCLCMDEYMCVRVPLNRLNDLQLVINVWAI